MSRNNISPLIKVQVEKLAAAGGGITSGRRLISPSSPISIPTKPVCSNTSSHSSSSYVSIGDQMSSISETFLQSCHETDDGLYTSLPSLQLTSQQLEHSAARDRIAVKNKLRQTAKQKLGTVKETDDNQNDLLCSAPFQEQTSSLPPAESIVQTQLIVKLDELDSARSRLRGRSAEKMLSTNVSSIQRSVSCKYPKEVKLTNRSIYRRTNYDESIDNDDNAEDKQEHEHQDEEPRPHSPPEEHIYDNFDLFKQSRLQLSKVLPTDENQSSANIPIQTREQSPLARTRLRPLTVHIPSNSDSRTVNEFENVFSQLKKHNITKKEEIPFESPVSHEPLTITVSSTTIKEEPTKPVPNENEPIVPHYVSTMKLAENPSRIQSPNRRKTVGGVHLPTNNKVATTDNQPTASWIDIAKQKQSKFQTISIEKPSHDESAGQTTPTTESILISRKQITLSSNLTTSTENKPEDLRSNRKSMFEPVVSRQASPPITVSNASERDSIRALKADRPNRINNLIQFFDK
ncbi:unnamed protein product [Adineta ricciae]|uniref:Uncharacterized protein n=1 Tax=Adineta ricciae TaxID=249248 RepID=A0A813Y1Q2_ADIRI|nr:unnamed protein product [Adineta ricciae]